VTEPRLRSIPMTEAAMDHQLVGLLLAGSSPAQAARTAHVPEAHVRQRMDDPAFLRLYAAGQRDAVNRVGTALTAAATLAIGTLVEVMRDVTAPAGARVRASEAVLRTVIPVQAHVFIQPTGAVATGPSVLLARLGLTREHLLEATGTEVPAPAPQGHAEPRRAPGPHDDTPSPVLGPDGLPWGLDLDGPIQLDDEPEPGDPDDLD
jgi:hypothetical protein